MSFFWVSKTEFWNHSDIVEMMSEADDALLHVHLDRVQPKSRLWDYAMTSGSAILISKSNCAITWANGEDAGKMFIPRLLPKGQCIPGVGSKRGTGQTLHLMCSRQNSAHFCACSLILWCWMVLTKHNKNIYNVPVPVLQKRAPSTVQLHISGSVHS